MTVPTTYGAPTDTALANYDFVDIAAGVGYELFYFACTGKNVNYSNQQQFVINNQTFYSDFIASGATYTAQNANTYTQAFSFDFETSAFNLPRVVNGEAIVTVPALHRNVDGAEYRVFATTKIYRITDSGASFELGQTSGATWSQTGGAGTLNSEVLTLKVPLTETIIKRDEKIRATVALHGACDAGGPRANNELYMGFDPQGRISSTRITRNFPSGSVTVATIKIPFKIDI